MYNALYVLIAILVAANIFLLHIAVKANNEQERKIAELKAKNNENLEKGDETLEKVRNYLKNQSC